MLKKQNFQNIVWADLENPTKDEARELMDDFGISPDIAQDILLPTFKDKIVAHKDYIYLVLHFPAFKHTHTRSHRQEIDFVIGKKFIITNRYESIDAMEKYSKIFEVNSILEKRETTIGPGEIFVEMLRTIYSSLSDELDAINYLLHEIEKNIFSGKEREMVFELSRIGREIINFNHMISPHGEILEALKGDASKIFGVTFVMQLDQVLNEYYKITKLLENITEVMHELRETNNSLLSTKQNEIMKMLTMFTFLALPFTVITGFFSMSTNNIPFINNGYFWYWIVAFEVIVLLVLTIIAKKSKWF
jgi:magnesium transporter